MNRIVKNLLSLSAIRYVELSLPLLYIPYFLRTLGPSSYGKLAFAMAFVAIFRIFINFGFNTTASRKLSQILDIPTTISSLFSTVLTIRILILLLIWPIGTFAAFSLSHDRTTALFYFCCFSTLLPEALCTSWFFLGSESMRVSVVAKLTSKLFYVIAIFFLIKDENDLVLVPLLELTTTFASSSYLILYIIGVHKIEIELPGYRQIKKQIMEGFSIFCNQLLNTLQDQLIPITLGFLLGNTALGLFNPINKLVNTLVGLTQPIGLAVYPRISRLTITQPQQAKRYINLTILIIILLLTFPAAILILYSNSIARILFGEETQNAANLLALFSVLPIILATRRFISLQGLASFNKDKSILLSSIAILIFSIAVTPTAIYFFNLQGAIIARYTIGLFGLTITYYFYRRIPNTAKDNPYIH